MKKALRILLVLSLLSLSLFAVSGCYKKHNGFEYIEEDEIIVIKQYTDNSGVSELTIPDSIDGKLVTKIANFGITDTTYLKKLHIGKYIQVIEPMALQNNVELISIEVSPENTNFKSVDGVLFTADGKELISYPPKNRAVERVNGDKKEWFIPTYTIPDGVEIIRPYAFYHVRHLETLIMSDSVKFIGEAAFFTNSDRLKSVRFSKGLEVISKDAFSLNKGLTEITIFENIKKIDAYAFFNCKVLNTVNICKSESSIELGEKWYPTDLGKKMKNLKINFDFVPPVV